MNPMRYIPSVLLVFGIVLAPAVAQGDEFLPFVRINEVMRSNLTSVSDDTGEHHDWFELFNGGDESFDLTGYALSDEKNDPSKWVFPEHIMPPRSYLVVFASDKDTIVSGGYSEIIINRGDEWRYRAWDTEPPADWKAVSYDDSGWDAGPSGFGYGDGDDATLIDESAISVYVRKSFTVHSLEGVTGAVIEADFDDGFVAYLNGVEVWRYNLGREGETIPFDTYASAHIEAMLYTGKEPHRYSLDEAASILRVGENVLAFQVHNALNSADMSLIPSFLLLKDLPVIHTNFRIAAGETVILTNREGQTLDSVTVPDSGPDISLGRYPDGDGGWFLYDKPTPGFANGNERFFGYIAAPVFSHEGGFHSAPLELELSTNIPGAFITYTLDGSEPAESSSRYEGPLPINTTTVVRARAFCTNLLPSPVVTRSYFIAESITLPVISISTAPEYLWDTVSGIFEQDNWKKDIEHPVYIEFFEPDGGFGFGADGGIRVHGAGSSSFAQKSLALFARSKYGVGEFGYRIFPEKDIDSFESFVLRNSGHDWGYSMMRGALGARLALGTDIDYLAYRPAIVFINGDYWGLYNIREKANEHYAASNHGVDPDAIDIMEYVISYFAAYGDSESFDEMIAYIESHDLVNSEYYGHIETLIDIDEFIDYFVLETYSDNGDWPGNNVKLWKSKDPGGKWRWIMYDLDVGFSHPEFPSSPDHNKLELALHPDKEGWGNYGPWSTFIARNLLKNETFRERFIIRFTDLLNTHLAPERVSGIIDEMYDTIQPEMTRHFTRWGGSMHRWNGEINALRDFAEKRNTHLRSHLADYFGLGAVVEANLYLSPAESGKLSINTVETLMSPWTGYFFSGMPLAVTAEAYPGYRFTEWEGASESPEMSITLIPTSALELVASFEAYANTTGEIVVNEINYNSADDFDPDDWIEIFNPGDAAVDISGWKFLDDHENNIFIFPDGTVVDPGGYLVVVRNGEAFTAVFPEVKGIVGDFPFGLSGNGDMVRLYDALGALVDSLSYDDTSPWPEEADGGGSTLALVDPELDNTLAENWAASVPHGTPGAPNDKVTRVDDTGASKPDNFSLGRNYPNPFNPVTTIPFSLPEEAHVTIDVLNILGQTVETLVDCRMPAGTYQTRFDAASLTSGVYFYRINAGRWRALRRMLLLR